MLKISEQCTGCGLCAEVCPMGIIEVGDRPQMIQETCMECGHCEAVCPENALYHTQLNHDSCREIPNPGHPVLKPEEAELFLRSRRSIRRFRQEPVTQKETEALLQIGRYAQTGRNSQGVSYLVLSGREKMNMLRKLTLAFYEESQHPLMQNLYAYLKDTSRDRLFRGAPMCILALTEKGNDYIIQNARYALTYIELYAPVLKLGTCWAGYLERYTSADRPELREFLKVPDDQVISGALLYGYPDVQYHRLTGRNPLSVLWR